MGGCNSSEEYDVPATPGYTGSRHALPGVVVLTVGLIALAIVAAPMLLLVFAVLVVAVRSQTLDAAGRKHSLQLVAEMTRLAGVLISRRRQ